MGKLTGGGGHSGSESPPPSAIQHDGPTAGRQRVIRDIDDAVTLQGATKAEVADAARRAGWTYRGRSRDGNGDVWVHPTKKGEQVIINDGYRWADDPVHRGPYVKVSRNGERIRYPLSQSEES